MKQSKKYVTIIFLCITCNFCYECYFSFSPRHFRFAIGVGNQMMLVSTQMVANTNFFHVHTLLWLLTQILWLSTPILWLHIQRLWLYTSLDWVHTSFSLPHITCVVTFTIVLVDHINPVVARTNSLISYIIYDPSKMYNPS